LKTKLKIYFTYKTKDGPFGGANRFNTNLRKVISDSPDHQEVSDIAEADIVYATQLSRGPGSTESMKISDLRYSYDELVNKIPHGSKLVVRAVNLLSHAFDQSSLLNVLNPKSLLNRMRFKKFDNEVIDLINVADGVIYQSEYQKSFFEMAGAKNQNFRVIHNGAGIDFLKECVEKEIKSKINILSVGATDRKTKRHDLLVEISKNPMVDVSYVGNWPKNLKAGKVKLKGYLNRSDLLKLYSQFHFYYHPAIKDPCPNSIFEAIASGLPVLYNPAPGSSAEIVKNAGFPLREKYLFEDLNFAKDNYLKAIEYIKSNQHYYLISRSSREYLSFFESILKPRKTNE